MKKILVTTASLLALGMGWRVYAIDQHFEVMRDALGLRLYEPGYGGKYAPESGG